MSAMLRSASLLTRPASLAVRPAMLGSLASLAALQPAALSGAFRGMAKRAKKATQAIRLVSQAGTGFFYTTKKNVRNTPEKLQRLKHDPVVNKHVLFREEKVKK